MTSELAIVLFFSQFTFGQWVVVSIVGMLTLGILTFVGWAAQEGGTATGFAFVWGAFVYWLCFVALTLVLGLISLCQWLWVL